MLGTNVSTNTTIERINVLADQCINMIANEVDCPKALSVYTESTKRLLNQIYPGFKCTNVIFTFNTDKEFFGCRIYPTNRTMNANDFADYFVGSCENIEPREFKSFTHYQIELDYRLFSSLTGLNDEEIATLIIHDIDQYIGETPFKVFSSHFEDCLANMETNLCKRSVQKCPDLFMFVFNECMRYLLSVFTIIPYDPLIDLNEVLVDKVDEYPLIREALYKINHTFPETNAEGVIDYKKYSVRNARILMQWYLNIYTTLDTDRYPLILLKKSIDYSGSELFKNKVKSILEWLNKYQWNNVDMGEPVAESAKPGFFSKLKMDGLKSIEDDLYEYKMRIRNVETQDDAILLMRQINNRMAILDEFLIEHPDLSEKDRKHWDDVFNKYQTLREELSDKAVYNKKMYGLFVDYNMLQQMSDSNQLMNTYY